MHELSLCRSIYGVVERARGDRQVRAVELQVGQLRQVVPATLEHCWQLVTDGTGLAGSVLDIDHVPVRLDCVVCGARTTVAHALVLVCGSCGAGDIRMVTGEEFLVTSLRLVPLPPQEPAEKPSRDRPGDARAGPAPHPATDSATHPTRPTRHPEESRHG